MPHPLQAQRIMNASPRDPNGAETVNQENVLLDVAERIGRIREGRLAVHLHLSALQPQNRQEGYLRVAGRMLEPMVGAYRGQIFQLSNADIVFLLTEADLDDVHLHLNTLRGLFAKDPLTREDSGDGQDRFCTVYDLTHDYDRFLATARQLLAVARARTPPARPEFSPLSVTGLGALAERLTLIDASPFVRRQSAISLGGRGAATVIFQEFFISLADLQKWLSADLQVHGDRWMSQYLAQCLDLRLLAALRRLRLARAPVALHLNLCLSTLQSPAYQAFEAGLPTGTKLGIEIQSVDLLGDSRAFIAARIDFAAKGHSLVIDGLDEATLRFLDVGKTGADLYKIDWSPDLKRGDRSDPLHKALRALDTGKLLLAHCDSEAAIAWGLEQGLTKFQGRYVEAMLAATTLGVCEQASACSLAQCVERHGVIGGPLRAECGNHQRLDTPPPMRAPHRPMEQP